jgi:hypothetical protein
MCNIYHSGHAEAFVMVWMIPNQISSATNGHSTVQWGTQLPALGNNPTSELFSRRIPCIRIAVVIGLAAEILRKEEAGVYNMDGLLLN